MKEIPMIEPQISDAEELPGQVGQPSSDVIKKRVKKVTLTPPKLKKSENAEFVSTGGQEYQVKQNSQGFWFIDRYKGGSIAKSIEGTFMRRSDAVKVLVTYLSKHNPTGRAKLG